MTTLDQLRVRTGYSDKGERITRPATKIDLIAVLLNEGAEKMEAKEFYDDRGGFYLDLNEPGIYIVKKVEPSFNPMKEDQP